MDGIEISEEEAQDFIDKFFEAYPRIKTYADLVRQQAAKTRVLRNAAGRIIRIDLNATNNEAAREGMNVPVQSLCSDMIKVALADLYYLLEPRGMKCTNTVHDELVFEMSEGMGEEVADIVKKTMEDAGNRFLKGIP